MTVYLNNEAITTEAATLGALLENLSVETKGIAVAVGSSVVARSDWDSHALAEGDRVTIIRATRGG